MTECFDVADDWTLQPVRRRRRRVDFDACLDCRLWHPDMTYEHPPSMVEGALVLLLVGFSLWYSASPDEVYGLVAGLVRVVAEQELVAEPLVLLQAAEQRVAPEGHLERRHRVGLRHGRDGRQRQVLGHARARLEVAAMVAGPLALHDFELPAHAVVVLVEIGLHALEERYRAGHRSLQLRGG